MLELDPLFEERLVQTAGLVGGEELLHRRLLGL